MTLVKSRDCTRTPDLDDLHVHFKIYIGPDTGGCPLLASLLKLQSPTTEDNRPLSKSPLVTYNAC